jgi:signal transduction protein with GAF and PtsI domain
MSNVAAQEILLVGARALVHADGLVPSLQMMIGSIAEHLDVESAVIFVVNDQLHRLEIAASIGLGDAATAGLVAAVGNPGHPIARTASAPVPSFDVLPTAPGGPALRSHLPLIVTRDGTDIVLGVLALAHDRPIGPEMRSILQAGADLAAVAIELHRPV